VTPSPARAVTPALLSDGGDISWMIYPVETVIAEKLHALVTHGDFNSRAKDIYDLALFLPRADSTTLASALKHCFEARKSPLPKSISKVIADINTKSLERGWLSATASVPQPMSFQDAFAQLMRLLQDIEA